MARTRIPTLKRAYNANEYTNEGKNGRIYEGVLGWRWHPFYGASIVEGSHGDGYKTRKEAKLAGLKLLNSHQVQESAAR